MVQRACNNAGVTEPRTLAVIPYLRRGEAVPRSKQAEALKACDVATGKDEHAARVCAWLAAIGDTIPASQLKFVPSGSENDVDAMKEALEEENHQIEDLLALLRSANL
jgi:hypothetical protein